MVIFGENPCVSVPFYRYSVCARATMTAVTSERIIKSVRKYPCIWNNTIEDYNAKTKKVECWIKVCEQVYGDEWGESTKEQQLLKRTDLKKKWHNIRDYHKKLIDSERRGGSGLSKRRKYVFADLLEFLRPIHEGDRTAPIYEEYLEEESYDRDLCTEDKKDPNILNIDNSPERTEERYTDPIERYTDPIERYTDPSEEDADLLFFKSLLPDLKKLTDSQKFDFKLGVMQLYKTIKTRTRRSSCNEAL